VAASTPKLVRRSTIESMKASKSDAMGNTDTFDVDIAHCQGADMGGPAEFVR
jgi:hypothetical protein